MFQGHLLPAPTWLISRLAKRTALQQTRNGLNRLNMVYTSLYFAHQRVINTSGASVSGMDISYLVFINFTYMPFPFVDLPIDRFFCSPEARGISRNNKQSDGGPSTGQLYTSSMVSWLETVSSRREHPKQRDRILSSANWCVKHNFFWQMYIFTCLVSVHRFFFLHAWWILWATSF